MSVRQATEKLISFSVKMKMNVPQMARISVIPTQPAPIQKDHIYAHVNLATRATASTARVRKNCFQPFLSQNCSPIGILLCMLCFFLTQRYAIIFVRTEEFALLLINAPAGQVGKELNVRLTLMNASKKRLHQ